MSQMCHEQQNHFFYKLRKKAIFCDFFQISKCSCLSTFDLFIGNRLSFPGIISQENGIEIYRKARITFNQFLCIPEKTIILLISRYLLKYLKIITK